MTDTEILRAFADLADREGQIHIDRQKLLQKMGWEYTSDTPGSLWVYQKTLPDGRVAICNASTAEEFEMANLDRTEFEEEEEE